MKIFIEEIKPNIEDKLHQNFHRKNSVKKQFEKKEYQEDLLNFNNKLQIIIILLLIFLLLKLKELNYIKLNLLLILLMNLWKLLKNMKWKIIII